MHILVAEDDKFLQNIYKVKLEKAGFEVDIAENGEKALESIKEKQYDLVLLDLVMPVMDGFSFLEEKAKLPGQKSIPVIITSNLGQQEDIQKGLDLGAKDYIVKSDTALTDLISKIQKLLNTV